MSENRIQFIHLNNTAFSRDTADRRSRKRFQSRTVAVLAVSPTRIRKIAQNFMESVGPMTVSMMVGITLVSYDDNYIRAKGREESVKKMKEVDLEIYSVQITADRIQIFFKDHENVRIDMRMMKGRGGVAITGFIIN